MKCTGFTLEELAGLQTLTPPPLGGGQTACAEGTTIAARVDSTIPIRVNLMFHMADSNPAISRPAGRNLHLCGLLVAMNYGVRARISVLHAPQCAFRQSGIGDLR